MEVSTKTKTFLVSPEDYDIISQLVCNIDKDGYVVSNINGKTWRIHRYIIIAILGQDVPSHIPIDHIDNDPCNNQRSNLRISSPKKNARNRRKRKGTMSKYIGVTYDKKNKTWIAKIQHDDKTIFAYYNKEEHAAHQYNLWCKLYNYETAKLNNIDINDTQNFVEWKPKEKKVRKLPKYVYLTRSNKYMAKYKGKHLGTYSRIEHAQYAIQTHVEDLSNVKSPIIRNQNDQCVIYLYNKEKEKIGETIVDDDLYDELIKVKWYVVREKYVGGLVNGKGVRLHRFLTKCPDNLVVDHINNNTFDNRLCNLRVVTHQQNSMNTTPKTGGTSQYKGVFCVTDRKKQKWRAYITFNGKRINLGTFSEQVEAAKARDHATRLYFGQYGKLNFPQLQT